MSIQIEPWQLLTFGVGLLISFFGAVFAAGKLLGGQWQKGLDDRFAAQDKARTEGSAMLRRTLDEHMEDERQTRAQLIALEREFLDWRSDLPHRHGERISHLETAIKAVPTTEDLARMYESINKLAGTVNQLVGENRGQTDTLRLILNRIMEKGMK